MAELSGKSILLPLCLVVIPVFALALQLLIARPVTDFSRAKAISASAPLIRNIEAYYGESGMYPESLVGLHKDYKTSVIGIERYEYARRGDSYNLSFEQPLFLLDALGAREIVVYNPRDQHVILSHAAWNLSGRPEDRARRRLMATCPGLGIFVRTQTSPQSVIDMTNGCRY